MVSSQDITVEQGGKNAEEIARFIEQLKEVSITYSNVGDWVGKVNTRVGIIESQIENNHIEYLKQMKKMDDILARISPERMKNLKQQNIVPLEMYEQVNMSGYHLQEMLAWKLYEFEMVFPLLDKIAQALSVVGAYEVESRVLDGVKDSQNRILQHAENMMTQKMSQQDQKIDLVKDFVNERTQMLLERQLMEFRDLQRLQQEADEKKWLLLIDFVEKVQPGVVSREDVTAVKKAIARVDNEGTKRFIERQKEARAPSAAGHNLFKPPIQAPVDEPIAKQPVDDRLFACPKCSARFKDSLQLDTHLEVEHSDDDDGGD
jgi:hypothetical protein